VTRPPRGGPDGSRFLFCSRFDIPQDRLEKNIPNRAYVAEFGDAALMVATEWDEFGTFDGERVYDAMGRPLILDGPAVAREMRARGFEYHFFGGPD